MSTTAPITGITGQDGSSLAELLLAQGCKVHAPMWRALLINTKHQHPHLRLHCGDLTNSLNLTRLLAEVDSDEIYSLAAWSHVA